MQTNDRIENRDGFRADVLKVSKDGKRLYIQFWGRGLADGKLVRMWDYAKAWKKVGG